MGNDELVIAIDGPSGSGKSSVGREVARRLGLGYLDTGAMYRAVTWAALEKGIDFCDSAAIAALAHEIEIIMSTDPDREYVALTHTGNDGTHAVTEAIRMPEVSGKVSAVAACAEVRRHLVRLQQELIATLKRRVVVDGRDITTVVAPDADFRLILTARPEVRIRRRWTQLDEAGIAKVSEEQLREQVVGRDIKDSEVNDFMDAADGVVVLDSSDLNFDGTVTAVMRLVLRKAGMGK